MTDAPAFIIKARNFVPALRSGASRYRACLRTGVQLPTAADLPTLHARPISNGPCSGRIAEMQSNYSNYGGHHGSWPQPSAQQFTGPAQASQQQDHASSMHTTSFHSTQTHMPVSRPGSFIPNLQGPSQQWGSTAPAAAAAGSFNYGFGDVPAGPQPTVRPSPSHDSMSTQNMAYSSAFNHQQQPQGAQPGQQHSTCEGAFPGAEPDSLKSVKDLPAPFQPIFSFRLVMGSFSQPVLTYTHLSTGHAAGPECWRPHCSLLRYFNPVQSECFDVACSSDTNMVGCTALKTRSAAFGKGRAWQG